MYIEVLSYDPGMSELIAYVLIVLIPNARTAPIRDSHHLIGITSPTAAGCSYLTSKSFDLSPAIDVMRGRH